MWSWTGRSSIAGFGARVPGDPSSAAFVLAAAALTGGEVTITGVGVNPSRLGFLDVLRRMGVDVEIETHAHELGEPVGTMRLRSSGGLRPVRVSADELPLVIDEVPLLAALAAHAEGPSRFEGASELRVKESDRLAALVEGIRALGGAAEADGDDLDIGGGGLGGGAARSSGDHRIAMALTVAAARRPRALGDRRGGVGSGVLPGVPRTAARVGDRRGGGIVSLRVVAIDGAAGSGKSTLARLLADELQLPYVNTGSMYRALTLAARRRGVDVEDGSALVGIMGTLRFTLSPGPEGELLIDGGRRRTSSRPPTSRRT